MPYKAWQLLRMLALWGIHIDSVARVTSISKTLCRVYLGVGLGFLQPIFLLTALLLAQHSLGCASQVLQDTTSSTCTPAALPARMQCGNMLQATRAIL